VAPVRAAPRHGQRQPLGTSHHHGQRHERQGVPREHGRSGEQQRAEEVERGQRRVVLTPAAPEHRPGRHAQAHDDGEDVGDGQRHHEREQGRAVLAALLGEVAVERSLDGRADGEIVRQIDQDDQADGGEPDHQRASYAAPDAGRGPVVAGAPPGCERRQQDERRELDRRREPHEPADDHRGPPVHGGHHGEHDQEGDEHVDVTAVAGLQHDDRRPGPDQGLEGVTTTGAQVARDQHRRRDGDQRPADLEALGPPRPRRHGGHGRVVGLGDGWVGREEAGAADGGARVVAGVLQNPLAGGGQRLGRDAGRLVGPQPREQDGVAQVREAVVERHVAVGVDTVELHPAVPDVAVEVGRAGGGEEQAGELDDEGQGGDREQGSVGAAGAAGAAGVVGSEEPAGHQPEDDPRGQGHD